MKAYVSSIGLAKRIIVIHSQRKCTSQREFPKVAIKVPMKLIMICKLHFNEVNRMKNIISNPNTEFKEGMLVTCSVSLLYEKYNAGGLQDNTIEHTKEDDYEYFDLYNDHKEKACMDGETCLIIEINEWTRHIRLKNSDGERDAYFSLTFDEALVGLTINP